MKVSILKGSISILLGIVFLFSAYIKLFPIELFEFSFIEVQKVQHKIVVIALGLRIQVFDNLFALFPVGGTVFGNELLKQQFSPRGAYAIEGKQILHVSTLCFTVVCIGFCFQGLFQGKKIRCCFIQRVSE